MALQSICFVLLGLTLSPCHGCIHVVMFVMAARPSPGHISPPWVEVLAELGDQASLYMQRGLSWHLPTLLEDTFNFILGVKPCAW